MNPLIDNPAPEKKARRGGRRPILKFADVLANLRAMSGNVSAVARKAGVSRASIHEFIARHPDLQAALSEARESRIDAAEDALSLAVERGEGWAICFTLKTIGKKRGFTERQELVGAEGGPIQIVRVTLAERRRRVEELIAQARQQCAQAPCWVSTPERPNQAESDDGAT